MPSYLHSFTCAPRAFFTTKAQKALGIVVSAAILAGCSVTPSSNTSAEAPKPPQIMSSKMTNDQVEALLEAEFILQREGAKKAFPAFYQIAQNSQDKSLLEKLLQVAAASKSNTNIEHSANLLLSVEPNNAQAYALKLQLLIHSKRPDDAARLLKTALKKDIPLDFLPDFIDKNIRNNDLMNTITIMLSQLSVVEHNNLSIKASDARVQFSSGDYPSAIKTAASLLKNDKISDPEPLYLIMAYSHNQLEHSEEAIKILENGMKRFPSSTRLLTPLLEFLVDAKQISRAVKTYQSADLHDIERVQMGVSFGNILLTSDHPKTALSILNSLPEPQYGFEDQVHFLSANALSDLNQTDLAIREMDKVNGILKTHATSQIALWLYDQGKEQQINAMVLARTSRAHIPEVVIAIGQLHEEHQHPELSLSLLEQALKSYPQSDVLRYRKALLQDSMGNWQSTVTELNTLLEKQPDNPQYLNALGYTLLTRTDQITKAMGYIEKAYLQDAKDPAIIDSLGWGFFLQGKLSRASYYLKQAWNSLHDDEIAAHYGEVLWQQKSYQEAIEVWSEALNDQSSDPLLLETIKRLHPSLLDDKTTPVKDNQ